MKNSYEENLPSQMLSPNEYSEVVRYLYRIVEYDEDPTIRRNANSLLTLLNRSGHTT